MALLVNPYIAGNPVGNTDAFVGRDDIQREVMRVLENPNINAITLFGQRRIGKTSVLQNLTTNLPGLGPYIPVYFDWQDKAVWPLSRVLLELARTISVILKWPVPELGEKPEEAFKTKWIPETLDALPEKNSLVLLFDEFDVLADEEASMAKTGFSSNIGQDLRKLNIHLEQCLLHMENVWSAMLDQLRSMT